MKSGNYELFLTLLLRASVILAESRGPAV